MPESMVDEEMATHHAAHVARESDQLLVPASADIDSDMRALVSQDGMSEAHAAATSSIESIRSLTSSARDWAASYSSFKPS